MSIQDLIQLVSQHPYETFVGVGGLSIVLIFICLSIQDSKITKRNKEAEIEKARKYYGDLSKGAIYLGQMNNRPNGYSDYKFSINGEEFTQSLTFGRFDKRPKENEHWRVELNGTDLKFVEKIGYRYNPFTSNNIRFYQNYIEPQNNTQIDTKKAAEEMLKKDLDIPKEANNPNNVTKISTKGIKPLEELEQIMKEAEPRANLEYFTHPKTGEIVCGVPNMLPAGQESIIKKESGPSARTGEPIQSPPDPQIYDINTCKPDKKGFYWVMSEGKWYAAWFSDAKDFYVANLGSNVPFKERYGPDSRTISHWAPIHLPRFVKV